MIKPTQGPADKHKTAFPAIKRLKDPALFITAQLLNLHSYMHAVW